MRAPKGHVQWEGYSLGTITGRRKAIAALVPFLFVLAGCTARQRLTRSVKASQSSLAAGDEFLIAGQSDRALEKYKRAKTVLSDWEAADLKPSDPLFRAGESVLEELGMRMGAFETPEGAAIAAVKLAGTEDEPDLAAALWNHRALAQKMLTPETAETLSPSQRSKLEEFAAFIVSKSILGNRELNEKIESEFSGKEVRGETVVLSGFWRFGQTKSEIMFSMQKEGSLWTVVDVRVGMLGTSLSEILFRGVKYASSVRPLEEVLGQEDAQDVLTRAFKMAYADATAEHKGTKRTASLVMDATFKTDDGYEREMGPHEMVELLGETRFVDGHPEVLVKTLDYVSDEEIEEGSAPPSVGWIPQEALPSTGEETLWGTE